MAARTQQVFRLNLLGRSSDLRDRSKYNYESQSDPRRNSNSHYDSSGVTVKLPFLHSITRCVKHNDVTLLTGADLRKLRNDPVQPENLQYESAHQSLVTIRKRHDEASKMRAEEQAALKLLQIECDQYNATQAGLNTERKICLQKVVELQKSLSQIKYQAGECGMYRKMLLHVVERMKHDKIVFETRKNGLEWELADKVKTMNTISGLETGVNEEEDRLRNISSKFAMHVDEEQRGRKSHLQSLEGMFTSRAGVEEKATARKQQMQQIAEKAMQDKGINEKTWQQIWRCHKLVQRFLRDKMDREMMKFNVVETAFLSIKTATGVNDADTFIHKFLNKEAVYGELLGKIADNEREIGNLKAQNEELHRERKTLKQQSRHDPTNSKQGGSQLVQEKQLRAVSNKLQRSELFQTKIRAWLQQSIRKFNTLDGNTEKITIGASKTDLTKGIQCLLAMLDEAASNVKQTDDISILLNEVTGKPECSNVDKEEQQEVVNVVEEVDCVNGLRAQVLRNNQRFMRQLKRKHEQLRKAAIEAEPKRKEVDKPKPVVAAEEE